MAAARLRVSVSSPDASTISTRGLGPWLSRIAPASARGELCVAIVSNRRMRSLNRQFRGKDYATDVLAFPSDSPGFLGDIVIAAGVAVAQAKFARHSTATELKVLSLHGLLHLLGYDHESDDGRMARAEARLRKKAGLPASLIERARPQKAQTAQKKR
jgi:probable rRNA maturation factor